LGFGALGLLLIYVIQPPLNTGLRALPHDAAIAIASTLLGILLVDTANSVRSLAKVRPVLDRMHGTLTEAHAHLESRATNVAKEIEDRKTALRSAHLGTLGRLSRVFPDARSVKAPRVSAAH
jgi:hypothetical protein